MTTSLQWDLGLGQVHPSITNVKFPGAVYSKPGGSTKLLNMLSKMHNVENDQVTITMGASMALVSALASLPDKDRGVLLPKPYFPAYPRICEALSINRQYYNVTNLSDTLGRDYSAIVINTPGNPLGNVYDASQLEPVFNDAKLNNSRVLLDLTYHLFQPEPDNIPLNENVLHIYSLGKSLGIPGERLGYVVGPSELIQDIEKMHWSLGMGPSMTSMVMASKLLLEGTPFHDEVQSCVEIALSVLSGIDEIEVYRPKGGFFLWIHVPLWRGESRELANWCLEQGINVVPAAVFGSPLPAVRVCAAIGNETQVAFEQLGHALQTACDHFKTK